MGGIKRTQLHDNAIIDEKVTGDIIISSRKAARWKQGTDLHDDVGHVRLGAVEGVDLTSLLSGEVGWWVPRGVTLGEGE